MPHWSGRSGLLLTLVLAAAQAVGCSRSADSTSPSAGAAPAGVAENEAEPAEVDLHPVVLLRTSLGDLTVRLNAEKAPRTVRNFLHYVDGGHYDGTIFHQIDAGYAALGGSYTSRMRERPGRYPVQNEADNGLSNVRGTIAMARDPDVSDSSVAQFFINLRDNPQLDHQGNDPRQFGYCVFGEVIEGGEVLERLSAVEVRDTPEFEHLPVETVLIETARRL